MAQRLTGIASRSVVRPKVDLLCRLLLRVLFDEGNSAEDDAAILRECSRLAMSAAHDLDPPDVVALVGTGALRVPDDSAEL
ncbi:MAG TPA: hypothetical protein VIM84_12740 [Gemmatimonadales bacterium]